MSTITHAQIQELVMRLPEEQLAAAHDLLLRLIRQRKQTMVKQLSDFGPDPSNGQTEIDELKDRHAKAPVMTSTDFMQLPLRERRRLMEKQAAYMT